MSNTIELPLVYFWRGKELWALVRIHSSCQKPLTTSSCILHLTLFRPLEDRTEPENVLLTERKRKFQLEFIFHLNCRDAALRRADY